MSANVTNCCASKCSLKAKIPKKNMIVGPTYCMNPVRDNGIRLAPAENKINGMAVTAPDNINQNVSIFKPTDDVPVFHK